MDDVEISVGSGLDGILESEGPATFDTWEYEGFHYHSIGIVNMWQRGYVPEGESWSDPPRKSEAFQSWLDANGCEWLDWGAFGPPAIKFPDVETMNRFEQEWHIPGEQKFADYLASPEAKALHDNNLRVLTEMQERLDTDEA
jgi:hypothetical protein